MCSVNKQTVAMQKFVNVVFINSLIKTLIK